MAKRSCSRAAALLAACLSILVSIEAALAAPEVKGIGVSKHTIYVASLYQDLLGRPPSRAELVQNAEALRDGTTSRLALSRALIASEEWRTDLVQDFYSSFLGRQPTESEHAQALSILATGASTDEVRAPILGSDEYFDTQGGGTGAGFANALYQDLLGRDATNGERGDIQEILRGGTNEDAARSVLTDANRIAVVAKATYLMVLSREASLREILTVIDHFSTNGTPEGLLAALFGMDEYFGPLAAQLKAGNGIDTYLGEIRDETNPSPTGVTVRLRFGDGRSGDGSVVPVTDGVHAVFGSHTYRKGGVFVFDILATGPAGSARGRGRISLGSTLRAIQPFAASFRGGVTVATGDVNGDGIDDVMMGAGGGAPRVKVFDGLTKKVLHSFLAFEPSFKGGVFVAAGDVNGDGLADVIVATGAGGGPHVKVFDGSTGQLHFSFFAFDAAFVGGVRVAAGDVDGDGRADIITGAGPGGGPHVKAFSGADLDLLHNFQAYDASFAGGIYVAAGDLDGDGVADIVTGAGPGAGPHVKAFSGADGSVLRSFFAYDAAFQGGVRVATGDVNGDGTPDVITAAGAGTPQVKVFDGVSLALLKSFLAYSPGFKGGVFVAAADVDGDGIEVPITGPGQGAKAIVKFQAQ